MSRHPVYNEAVTDGEKCIGAWYMSGGGERMLVVHNFGGQDVEVVLTDAIDRAVAVNGDVRRKGGSDGSSFRMGAYCSVVFKLRR